MSLLDWEPLAQAALKVRLKAYAPYSGYKVGAALLGINGKIYTGANVENASYPVGLCAERAALAAAISDGCHELIGLAIATPGPKPGPPCGMCRQALNEFARTLPILLVTPRGAREEHRLRELLPGSFNREMLTEGADFDQRQLELGLEE